MKILDKVKTIFWDNEDEEDDDEIPEEKIMPTKKRVKEEPNEMINERDLFKTDASFKFPVVFTEEDFAKTIPPEKPVTTRSKNEYNKVEQGTTEKKQDVSSKKQDEVKTFRVSPAISPIYGVLDKNYKKEDIKSKTTNVSRKKEDSINFESVRKKAYGTLADEIENTLTGIKVEEAKEKVNPKKDITIEEAINGYNESGMVYNSDNNTEEDIIKIKKDKKAILEDTIEQDLFNLIDSMYDKEENGDDRNGDSE